MRRRVMVFRDIAIGTAGICGIVHHLIGGRWGAAALAAVAAGGWVIVGRAVLSPGGTFAGVPAADPAAPSGRPGAQQSGYADRVIQALFLLLGSLFIVRFAEARIWLTAFGLWSLVCAADLSRLSGRFPVDSPPLDQRAVVVRRLRNLGLLGAISGVLIALARVMTLQLRLVAIVLLSLFVVMIVVRLIRSVAAGAPGDDEQMRR